MKRGIITIIFLMMMVSFASATIIINQQPGDLYNLGDTVNVPLKISASSDVSTFFIMNLICDGIQTEIHKEFVILSTGEEKEIDATISLMQRFIGKSTGSCKVKAQLGEEYILTGDFEISDSITVEPETEKLIFLPEEELTIEGDAKKENGEPVHGFIEINLTNDVSGESIDIIDTVNLGYFSINFPIPEDMKAGVYSVELYVYEKGPKEEITNQGSGEYDIEISQVPKNLEIIFENSSVEPGTNMKVKAILRDQTGEPIASSSIITVKDDKDTILEQIEKPTNEFLEIPILYKEPAAEWTVVAVSNKITSNANFEIIEKEAADIRLINKTVTITNVGNILYNETVTVNIGNESVNIDAYLKVDGSQKYTLSAPDGEYQIEIFADGEGKIDQSVMLTGKAISVKEASGAVLTLVRHPFVWIFIIGILGFVAFIVFKKGYKRSFFGYIPEYFKKKDRIKSPLLTKDSLINPKNKAELSLSIKGDKQNISLICLKLKNFDEIKSTKSNAKETLQEIVNLAEERKAVTYENQENLFFIFAPIKTRTFGNEGNALETAQMIHGALSKHNKLFKQKIDFGISLNNGTIIAKQEDGSLKFMSMGTLITTAKKIALASQGEVFLSENINDRLKTFAKTQKKSSSDGKTPYFAIKEIKKTEDHKKFINNFLKGLEKDKKGKK